MPTARLLCCAGYARATTDSTMPNPVHERPRPTSKPAERWNLSALVECGIIQRPSAYARPPANRTRAAPKRSAMAPANGIARPHTRFCSAIAKENVSRPQPRSSDIGTRKRPKLCRVPIASRRIRPPQTSTTVGVRHAEPFSESSPDAVAGLVLVMVADIGLYGKHAHLP